MQPTMSIVAMADEKTIIINGVRVVKLQGTCNYGLWLATLQRALEVPDPELWRLITDKHYTPGGNEISSFLETKVFARRYVAQTRGITAEAVSEQEVNTCLSDILQTVGMLIRDREEELDDEWRQKDYEALDILRSTISDQVEYDLDIDYVDDIDLASEYFSHLQAKYGPTGYLSQHKTWNEWTSLRYDGKDRDDREVFVPRFKAAKTKVDQTLGFPVERRLEFLQFLSAISGHPECKSMLTLPPLGSKQLKDEEQMEQVYRVFIRVDPRWA